MISLKYVQYSCGIFNQIFNVKALNKTTDFSVNTVSLKMLYFSSAFSLSNAVGRLREFHLSNYKMSISEVLKDCTTNYTNLVTVYDHEDNEKLFELVKTINVSDGPSAFIGAHTNNTKYTSKWSNGDDVTFTSFTMNCTTGICGAAMRSNGSWELLPYTTSIYFMCYDEGNHLCVVYV